MSSATYLQLGRLSLPTLGHDFKEAVGEPLDTAGAGVALGQRRPKGFGFTVPLLAIPDGTASNFIGEANRMRRQLRSMLQNSQLRGQALYLQVTPDMELNGWVIPGNGQIAWQDGGPTFGNYLLTLDELYRIGTRWTHRPGLRFVNIDRRLATTARDYLAQVFSTDFAGLSIVAFNALPPGATDAIAASGRYQLGSWSGVDGPAALGINYSDGDVVSFEQPEASRNLGQVLAYDRRGNITAPTTGPDPLWEEVYGDTYPWNWLTASQPNDCPVLSNGKCRVRYDASVGLPGLRIDVWTGTAWAEQGKIVFQRRADGAFPYLDTWRSANLVEYTFERAVVEVVLSAASDARSHELVYITLQRGWSGPRFEAYPAIQSTLVRAGIGILWYDALPVETNESVMKIDTGGAVVLSGINSGFASGYVGASSFPGENHWTQLAQGRTFSPVGAVVQAAAYAFGSVDAQGYGVDRNLVLTAADAPAGYVGVQYAFPPQASDQTLEAEAIRVTGSTTTSQVADATASGGQCVMDTQAAETAGTVAKTTNLLVGTGIKYRLLARVKVDAGATGSFRYSVSGSTGVIATTTSTTWVWLDLGDFALAGGGVVSVNAWRSAGASGNVYIDRIEAYNVENNGTFDGARHLGQMTLMDCRSVPVLVER